MTATPTPATLREHRWFAPLLIFFLALTVRTVFVLEVRHAVFWSVPLVDAQSYDQLAREMVREGLLGPYPTPDVPYTPYFQPPLYTLFLAFVYLLLGPSTLAVKVIQHLLGAASCVLLYELGRLHFGRKIALAAGLLAALTAPLFFYESLLLPPALLIFLNLLLLLLLSLPPESAGPWRWPLAGLLLGFSAILRPDILLFLPLLLLWIWWTRRTVLPTGLVGALAIFLLAAALPVALTAVRNQVVGRDPALISTNGGVNFFVGNYPDMEGSLSIRPGLLWQELLDAPKLRAGLQRPSERSAFFYREAFRAMADRPGRAVVNLGKKFVWIWRGPELRRNEDEYYLTGVSRLYRLLLWRVGGFGFPFGLLAPLALAWMLLHALARIVHSSAVAQSRSSAGFPSVGLLNVGLTTPAQPSVGKAAIQAPLSHLATNRCEICGLDLKRRFLLFAYVVAQVLMLVLFFPSSRYRAAMVPILLLFAVALVGEVLELVRRGNYRRPGLILALALGLGLATALVPPGFEGGERRVEAESRLLVGDAYQRTGNLQAALAEYRAALLLQPDSVDAHKLVGAALYLLGRYAEAETHLAEVVRRLPNLPEARAALDTIRRKRTEMEARPSP